MGRGPSPSRQPPRAERGGREPSSGCRQSCEEAGTEPPSLSLAPLAQAACFLGVTVQLTAWEAEWHPTRDRPCRPFPRGDVKGGAGTPARPVRPRRPGATREPYRPDQLETEEAGAAGWGSWCQQTGARCPISRAALPAAGSMLARASGGLAPGSPRLPADPLPSWKVKLSGGPGLRGLVTRVAPGRHRAGTGPRGVAPETPESPPPAPDAGGRPFPVPSGRGRVGAAGMS